MSPIDRLPDSAAVRIFHTARPLTAGESERLGRTMDAFLASWTAHGERVAGAWTLLDGRFLVVAADETRVALSGCARDQVIHAVRALEGELAVDILRAPPVAWRDGAEIRCADRAAFGELAAAGRVGPETTVFDETVPTLGDIRHGRFEAPARATWHARAFDLAVGR